ncbi:hypothetical protein EN45_083490 [Penicillium chrysogenum]|uniref:C2H2-type domain-containing protein n=1 Tax=Penicillium chrysogenum TaxID=5076 RepID=A0A167UW21_PENCH|nr:hypothetical protein EN45_083490 [Penicillium chrysogenum]
MSNGGINGFDWLQSFLPADSQTDPNINNEAYQTHQVFHDAEGAAKAAFMQEQAHMSYSFMRSTNSGTNHALNHQMYSHASGAESGGKTHQQNSNIQFDNPPSNHSANPTGRSHNSNHRPNPPAPSQQQHLAPQAHQGAYGHVQTRMGPAGPPQRPSGSMPNSSAHQSTHRVYETTRPTVTAQGMNQPMARAVPTYESPYQRLSSNPKQNPQNTHGNSFLQLLYNASPQYSAATSFLCSKRNQAEASKSKDTFSGRAPRISETIPKPLDDPSSEYPANILVSCSAETVAGAPSSKDTYTGGKAPSIAEPTSESFHDSNQGPRLDTFSHSAVAKQPAVDNAQSRRYPLPGPLPHHKIPWVPAGENYSDSMPPAKKRLLDSGKRQTITPPNDPSAGSSAPGAQVPMENARPRGHGRILKNRGDLVQQINPSDALPKKSYDPTTIARDVLIAAGRHPKEKHLNHHLDPLRRNFTRIDYYADLATFRWDLVDAEQPEPQVPPVPAPQIPRPIPHPQWESRPRDPTSTSNHVMARDHALVRDTPPNRQVALPERIDARAPPGGLSAWGTLPFKPPTYHSPQHILSSNLPSGLPRVEAVPSSPKFSSKNPAPLPTPPAPPPHPPPHPPPQPEQRRRSTTNSAATPKPPPTTKQVSPKSTTKPKPQRQTVENQSDSGRTVKSPEARRLPQPEVVIPLSPAKMPTKRRGRAPKSVGSNIEVAIHREQPVDYQIFPCKWEGCAAQLHNIDSVRAHVIKVHIPHSLVCKWKDCGNKTPMAAADMFQHLATEHISKIAWELGDGPTVPVTAENNPNHPSVLGDRSARKGTMVLPVDEHQVKAFSKAHGKSTEKTKAQALIEAGRHWKQQIGPEMDWSDRRLSTPARQRRVHTGEIAFVGES